MGENDKDVSETENNLDQEAVEKASDEKECLEISIESGKSEVKKELPDEEYEKDTSETEAKFEKEDIVEASEDKKCPEDPKVKLDSSKFEVEYPKYGKEFSAIESEKIYPESKVEKEMSAAELAAEKE